MIFTTTTTASEDLADHPLATDARRAAVEAWKMLARAQGFEPAGEPSVVLLPDHSWQITGPVS